MTFEDLRLNKPLLEAVRAAGYETPTPIQAQVIPLILGGNEVLACAQTGTGKTAAFALPILQRLGTGPSPKGKDGGRRPARDIRALVVAPTRELAQQISDSFSTYGRFSGLRHTVVYGGVGKNPQIRALRAGVDILVATPGRLLDHMSDGLIRLDCVEVLVLDEADRMLDMGFLPDIRRILAQVPKRRQSLLLSATMPRPIRDLAKDILLKNPVSVEVARVSAPAEKVEHWAYRVEKREKPALLFNVLQHTPYSKALIFTRTKHGADKVVRHLTRAGVSAAAIHGNKTQNARTRALAGFRSGRTAVLVATDIAARGLDIDDISHVINYDLTTEPETYVHRIGRTGRAGATGTALSFVSSEDHDSLRAIERLIRTPLQPAANLPGYVAPKVTIGRTNGDARPASRRNGTTGRPRFAPKNGARRRPRRGERGPRGVIGAVV
ncbi:MAG: DEAD/DEAH box helicase [bacterium]|nr:DEAD/DEAH box helicase [bacterium]